MGAGSDALKAAIDAAWRVFDLPAPKTTGVCVHCCMYPEIEADFLKRKARDLPADYIRDWYFAACSEGIGHDHVAWFLPRVMEMLANEEEVAVVGHEVIFARLPLAGFPDRWPVREVAAVNHFALAYFETRLTKTNKIILQDIDSWLCMIGQGGIGIDPFLRRMDALSDSDLADLLYRNWFYNGRGSLRFDAFWSVEPARTTVWNWYISPVLSERMQRAAMAGNERASEVYGLIISNGGTPPPA
jgi:hypothetical protein